MHTLPQPRAKPRAWMFPTLKRNHYLVARLGCGSATTFWLGQDVGRRDMWDSRYQPSQEKRTEWGRVFPALPGPWSLLSASQLESAGGPLRADPTPTSPHRPRHGSASTCHSWA